MGLGLGVGVGNGIEEPVPTEVHVVYVTEGLGGRRQR